jgi:hypothetical protein
MLAREGVYEALSQIGEVKYKIRDGCWQFLLTAVQAQDTLTAIRTRGWGGGGPPT